MKKAVTINVLNYFEPETIGEDIHKLENALKKYMKKDGYVYYNSKTSNKNEIINLSKGVPLGKIVEYKHVRAAKNRYYLELTVDFFDDIVKPEMLEIDSSIKGLYIMEDNKGEFVILKIFHGLSLK